jgi:UDPglucose 6-dehydrogenase
VTEGAGVQVPGAVAVVGLGKLGSPMAACFAAKGFATVGVDLDPTKVHALNTGRAPIFEPQLQETIDRAEGRLRGTIDLAEAVAATEATFVVVATPSEPEGGFSLRYVLPAFETIGTALREKDGFHLVVLTSTVMPGATDAAIRPLLEEASGKQCGSDFGLCYSPEFIALGSVIRDFLNPDFLLVGESDRHAGDVLSAVYERVCDNDAPIARMNFVNAELAKLSVNAYVTTKITFANTLARLCERLPEADVDVVTGALGLDTRIGPKYLRGAISYGGPCFPRDNIALAALARTLETPSLLAEATDRSNRDAIADLAMLVEENLPEGGTAGVLGLSYKPNTDVVEESASLLLVSELLSRGVDVVSYDPAAMSNAERVLGESARFAATAEAVLQEADVVVLATPWPELVELDPGLFAPDSRPSVLIDCWRVLPPERFGAVTHLLRLGEGTHAEARLA